MTKKAGGNKASASQKTRASPALKPAAAISPASEFDEVLAMMASAPQHAYQAVNTELVGLCWQLGEYISHKIESAQWRDGVVDELAATIARHYPGLRGCTRPNLFRMRQFYHSYRDDEKVSAPLRQLTTSPTLVAEYQTVLPPKELLRQKLHELYAQLAPPGAKATTSKRNAPPKAEAAKKLGRGKR